MVSTLLPRPIYSSASVEDWLKLGRIFSALRCAVRIRLLRERQTERERERIRLVFAGIGTADKWENFPGAVFRARSQRETTLAALAAFRKATHPSVFVPACYSRVAARNCPCISESLIVCATSDYVLELFLSAYAVYVPFSLKIHLLPPKFLFFFYKIPPL